MEVRSWTRAKECSMKRAMSGVRTLAIAATEFSSSVIEELRRDLDTSAQLDTKCLNEASARLGVSPRTLQRRLDRQGTSFSVELERARKARALRLVTTTERPLAVVAKELGFSDASTFSRAFLRWFARPPGATRAAWPLANTVQVEVTATFHAANWTLSPTNLGSSCTLPAPSQLLACAPGH